MKNLKKIVNSDAAYEILDRSNCAGSTWTEGGCAILAQALNMLEGYPIYVIYNKRVGSSEHFGVMTPSGAILDADGEHRNTDAWLNFFKENEMPRAGELVVIPFNYEVDMEGINFDDAAARELAGLIGKQSVIREAVQGILKESDEKVWYHGTPDVREIEKEGGFTQKFLNIDYVDDIDGWENYQKELASRRESGDEDGYFKLLGSHDFRKSAKIRKLIFLSDVFSVAKTYTNRMAFDYQNSIEKVLKVKVKSNNGVVISAPGHRFRFIDIEPVKRGFISAGVNEGEFDLIVRKLNYAQGVKKGIRTDDIAAIGDWFGFDYIDVVGVLDSYEGGNTKSTVRMVFNPSDIDIIKESVNLREFEEYIDSVFNVLKESDEPSPTFEWDIAKQKIDNSKSGIRTREQAYEYLVSLLDKIKNLPKSIKLKITKYAVMSFMMLLGAGVINGVVSEKTPEISREIAVVVDNVSKGFEKKKEVEIPRKSSESLVEILKHEEGSIKYKGEPVLKAYKLGDGMITVGWGHAERIHNSKFRPGQEITRKKAEELLAADIIEAERGLNIILDDWKEQGIGVKITQPMYDAMISMIFNMGIGNFRKSDFIQLVKDGDYEMAAERILTTNVSYPGHIPRREKESRLFSKGLESSDISEVRKMIRNILKEEVGGENFNAWFSGSKVTDSNGNPLIVHHGTSEKFSKFNLKKTTQGIIWFTSNRNSVEAGEVGAQGRGHIMDLYVRIKNPAGWDEYDKYTLDQLQNMGYDGAILPDSDGSITGFVFNPGQLKSAANKGEWSSGNDNIFKEDLSEIREIIRKTIKEEVIEETQVGQKDIEKLANDILKSLSYEILKEKSHMIFLTDNEDEPIMSFPMVNTIMYNGAGFNELSNFIEETNIRIVPTKLIRGREGIKGELEYGPGDMFGNEFYKIWLKYDTKNLEGINELFRLKGKDITKNDIYFNIFYLWHSILIHELQHAYDAWRSKGKAFGGQLKKSYTSMQDKASQIRSTKSGYDDLTPEEIDAINDSRKAYLNLVHEINARYAQAMQKTILTTMDYDTFDDIKKNWNDVIGSFRVNFDGWRHLSDKMKKKLTRRVAKAYQEAIENLKTASEKYSKEDLEAVNENFDSEGLEYRVEHMGAHNGQEDLELGLYMDDEIIGMVQYTLFNGHITVRDIIVRPEFRRKGYGSKMMKYIKSKHPKYKYLPSMKTDLGAKFVHKDVNINEIRKVIREIIKESLFEGKEVDGIDDMTKLSVFDFDSTLVNTPLPETGMKEWEQKTNTPWPGGWWGVPESLDTDVFEMSTNSDVISAYKKEMSNPHNLVVMMTGRTGKLSKQVEKILSMNGLKFHDYLYNDGGETSSDKKQKMEMILQYNPNIREIEMWDDRDSHIPVFKSWGDDLVKKGYLESFKINHVKGSLSESISRSGEPKIEKVYHGTSIKKSTGIRNEGLQADSSMGYNNSNWYMVSTDFESALFHARADEGEDAV